MDILNKELLIISILDYLHGIEKIVIEEIVENYPELLVRCIKLLLHDKISRKNTCKSIILLMNRSTPEIREYSWQLIQEIPLSNLLEIAIISRHMGDTSKLKHPIACKLAKIDEKQLLRAYFLRTSAFKDFFNKFYLPRTIFHDKPIINHYYKIAYKLSKLSNQEAMELFNIDLTYLVKNLGLPVEIVIEMIEDYKDAEILGENLNNQDFLFHCFLFEKYLSKEKYNDILIKKFLDLDDPFLIIFFEKYLNRYGAMTLQLRELFQKKLKEIQEDYVNKDLIKNIAILVDTSGSNPFTIEIGTKLHDFFERVGKITDLISFNDKAEVVNVENLKNLKPKGYTAIGSSLELLKQRINDRKYGTENKRNEDILEPIKNNEIQQIPQAIFLISDLGENRKPTLNEGLELMRELNCPPLIIILCGQSSRIPINYPHVIIEFDHSHENLIIEILFQLDRITRLEFDNNQLVKSSKQQIIDIINQIDLKPRPKESLQKGYLDKLLTEHSSN